jgi:cytochrome c553
MATSTMIRRFTFALTAVALMGGLLAPRLASAQSRESPPSEAAFISANCANCHGPQGRSAGVVPSLAGLPRGYILEQMQAFKTGARSGTIMHQLAKGFTDEQIGLLAEHFAKQTAGN